MMPTVLNPWAIGAGAAALALPFVIHWLTRPHPATFPLSTIRFVRQIVHQRRAASRLRDIFILLVRALALAMLAYAFARPFLGSKPLIAGSEQGTAVRVVVLDDSLSMSAVSHGITPFERGRQRAAAVLAFQQGMQADLIFAGPRPRPVFDGPTTNLAALREALATANPQPYTLNVQQTINRAADMLVKSDPVARRELVIISDFQRANWANVDFSPLPKDTLIQLEPMAPSQTAPNMAVLRVGTQGRAEQGQTIKMEVEVGNYTSEGRKVQAQITLGQSVFELEGLCPKGVRTTMTGEVTLPSNPGWISGWVKLLNADDSLPADNSRPFVVNVRPAPVYALITRQPQTPQATSSQFLERALVPSIGTSPTDGTSRVLRITPESADMNTLAQASVLVIDHPGKIPGPVVQTLAALVQRGKPIIYIASEPADAVNLKLFADAAGTNLHLPVDFVPPQTGVFRRDLFIADAKRDQAPFHIFGADLPAVLAPLKFGGGLATPGREGGLTDDILATYSDRSAALVVTACGAGSLAVLNADLSTSNLPADPAFVPLLGELVNRLLTTHDNVEIATAGEPFAVFLPTDAGAAATLTITPTQDVPEAGVLSEENGFVLWRSSAALPPNVYEATRGKQRIFALAVTLPAAETDLNAMDMQVLKTRLAGGRRLEVHTSGADDGSEQNDNTWAWLLSGCIVCFLVELVMLRAFRT